MSIIQLSINEFPVDKSQQRRFTKHETRTQLENAQHGNLHHNRKITQKFQLHKTCSKSRGEKKKYNRRSKLSITLHIKKLHWRITVQLPGLSMQHFFLFHLPSHGIRTRLVDVKHIRAYAFLMSSPGLHNLCAIAGSISFIFMKYGRQ